ncbi:MAG TPA: acetate--CoA ligase family protein, partial [Streptomyces sp.]|nr:acetate--CoA ligase family protein [Streptomyces sp.]
RQAGVIMVDTVTELLDAGALLVSQPLPGGPRTGILGNAESLGLITYDACLAYGLRPQPVRDLTTSATPEEYRHALRAALDDPETDAVVVTVIPWVGDTPVGELADALREASADSGKPVTVVHLAIEGLDDALSERGIPSCPAPERAVRALSEVWRYARWRQEAQDPGRVPEFEVDEGAVSALLERATADAADAAAEEPAVPGPADTADHAGTDAGTAAVPPAEQREEDARPVPSAPAEAHSGLTLGAGDTESLLASYGITVQPTSPASGPDEAAAAAERIGYPVALKTTAPHLRHRADLGGVRLDISSEAELRRAYAEMTDAFGKPEELRPVVQAMAPRGVDTVVKAAVDPSIGAVLSFGLAGTPSELLGDVAHRLVPATDREAAELVRALRSAPILFGWRGAQPVDTEALEELLLRVSSLLHDHPGIVAVELEPVVVASRGLTVLGAAVRVTEPTPRADLGRRSLPAY